MKQSYLFLPVALLQGIILWWFNYTLNDTLSPVVALLRYALLYSALAVPLAIYCTQNVEQLPHRIRWLAVTVNAIVFSFIGFYLRWSTTTPVREIGQLPLYVALLVLCFTAINLLTGFNFRQKRWEYTLLFHYTWRNGTLMFLSLLITGIFWVILQTGAALMSFVGIEWLGTLIGKEIFVFPSTCLVIGIVFDRGIQYSSITSSVSRFASQIAAWLLLLMLFFSVIWAMSLPFSGWEAAKASSLVLLNLSWFILLAVALVSCVYQGGQIEWPYPRWLSLLAQLAWLSLIPLAFLLCWLYFSQSTQAGWTVLRIWGALLVILSVLYSIGYSLSWLNPSRWMSAVGTTNLIVALFLCIALFALLTPIANINHLSKKLLSEKTSSLTSPQKTP